jgi:acyl-[acyl-carrier-protein]-phospholipid O-acyltransferase/long-chain-fatty-acid--[acyl-carrier-protein] ligase
MSSEIRRSAERPTDPAPAIALRAVVAAQFFGAFNDNALRIAVALLGVSSAIAALDSVEARTAAAQTRMTLAFVAFTLPLALISIPAGVLADRVSKRSVIVAMKALEIGLMLGASAALWADPSGGPLPLALLACMGAQSALFSPAKYGILPELLPERHLSRGNGLLEMWSFLAIIGGTYSGGLLVWWAGEDTCELSPVSRTPRIARKCDRSVPWRNGSGARSRASTRLR